MKFDVAQLAKQHGWKPDGIRHWMRVLEIPQPEQRQPHHWQLLRQVIEGKHQVTMPIAVSARVIFPIGIRWIEKVTVEDGKAYLWALGDPYPIDQCYYLYPYDRLGDWFGKCPKCYQNASDYVKRQKVAGTWHGGYAFCESCLVSWKPDFLNT